MMNDYLDSSLLKPIVNDVNTFAEWCRQQMFRDPKIPDIDMQRLKGLSF